MLSLEYPLWARHCSCFFSVYHYILLLHILVCGWWTVDRMKRSHFSTKRLQMLFESIKSIKRKKNFICLVGFHVAAVWLLFYLGLSLAFFTILELISLPISSLRVVRKRLSSLFASCLPFADLFFSLLYRRRIPLIYFSGIFHRFGCLEWGNSTVTKPEALVCLLLWPRIPFGLLTWVS